VISKPRANVINCFTQILRILKKTERFNVTSEKKKKLNN